MYSFATSRAPVMLEGVAERAAQDASAQGAQNEQLSAETKDFGEMYGQIIGTSKETNECMNKNHIQILRGSCSFVSKPTVASKFEILV